MDYKTVFKCNQKMLYLRYQNKRLLCELIKPE